MANPVQQLFIVNRWKKSRVHSGSRDLSVKIGNRGILPLVKKRIERYRVRGLMFLWIFVLDFVGIWSVKRYESYFKKIEFSRSTCSVFFVESSLNGNKKKKQYEKQYELYNRLLRGRINSYYTIHHREIAWELLDNREIVLDLWRFIHRTWIFFHGDACECLKKFF